MIRRKIIRRRFPRKRVGVKKRFTFRRRRFGTRGGKRRQLPNRNYATITETIEEKALVINTGILYTTNIGGWSRAQALAPNYRYYRLKALEWEFQPKYDTFQEGATTGGASMPVLWWSRAKYQPAAVDDPMLGTVIALDEFRARGAKSFQFKNRKVIRYKPNLSSPISYTTQDDAYVGAATFTAVYNRWIPTQRATAATVPNPEYYGHYVFVQQDTPATTPDTFNVIIRAIWEFKEPMTSNLSP